MSTSSNHPNPSRRFSLSNERFRATLYQSLLAITLVTVIILISLQTISNMEERGIALSFDFLEQTAGFQIDEKLIEYNSTSSFGKAYWVGLLNTLLVSVLGILFATLLGFVIGVSRLSENWIVSKFAATYVEIVRTVPLLLQLLFWYNAVLKALPAPKASLSIFGSIYINNRGLLLPEIHYEPGGTVVLYTVFIAAFIAICYWRYAKSVQTKTGRQLPVARIAVATMFIATTTAIFVTNQPFFLVAPELKGFNFRGGNQLSPEFAALLVGLSVYTASYIAEIVRGGILAVPKGQTEAAHALGHSKSRTLRLIVIPQALRVILPPLTNQYLNLTKNSSLAVFIGYPDLVQVFAGSVLNLTGAAVQVMAITLATYLTISLAVSAGMHVFNVRFALVER